MFDPHSVALIRQAPPLEGLDLDALPKEFTRAYATIVTTRVRLQEGRTTGDELPVELAEVVSRMQRLAAAHEAYAAALPDRPNRAAAAFVAASAHHACHLADQLRSAPMLIGGLSIEAIAPAVASTLLFLISEQAADAMEMANRIRIDRSDLVEAELLAAIVDLARGRLTEILARPLPTAPITPAALPDLAVRSLWLQLLHGVRALAASLLGPRAMVEHRHQPADAARLFDEVKGLSIEPLPSLFGPAGPVAYSVYTGPHHLASLLSDVASGLQGAALVSTPPPSGVEAEAWATLLQRFARERPYLWPNHRAAIATSYLDEGVSAAISFPTGGGKSTLSELKIATVLLRGEKVLFLAPTLALVDQTATNLQRSFPDAHVQHDLPEEGSIAELSPDAQPNIWVMTPERCLAALSFGAEIFSDVGLLVFDECHLLHPRDGTGDRRSVDAMLALLTFIEVAPKADLLLLSAMMGNAETIAAWIEDVVDRSCLALTVDWKPTRQARGCIVYEAERTRALRGLLERARRTGKTSGVPLAVKRALTVQPYGLFCLHQTWQSKERSDYALLRLMDEEIILGAAVSQGGSWYLTANRNAVAAALATKAGDRGIKTMVFAQTVKDCDGTVKTIRQLLSRRDVKLTSDEERLFAMAVEEAGSEAHVYYSRHELCVAHHGLLLPAERHLCESLFRRRGGIDVLVATSTLAQGMNLPTEVVIIAGDDRFDANAGRAKQLEAHELLNAAGRAGRAGEAAQALVLVIPGKVIDIDDQTRSINRYWFQLQTIFAKTDQCLEIEDPITSLLDQIHVGAEIGGGLAGYLLSRLPVGEDGADQAARIFLHRSLAVFQAKQRGDDDWAESRIETALEQRRAIASGSTTTWHDRLAAATGISAGLIRDLDADMHNASEQLGGTAEQWIQWFIDWLAIRPIRVKELLRHATLNELFGRLYTALPSPELQCAFVIDRLRVLVPLWASGATLRELELALGTASARLGRCERARVFTLRLVPEIAYAFGLISQVHRNRLSAGGSGSPMPLVVAILGSILRDGFNSPECFAVYQLARRKISRVAAHRQFKEISAEVSPGHVHESFSDMLQRVRVARRAWIARTS